MLEKCVLTVLELNWNKRLGHKKTKLNICQICKFVGFLLPSSSWLLKLPNLTLTISFDIPNFRICVKLCFVADY